MLTNTGTNDYTKVIDGVIVFDIYTAPMPHTKQINCRQRLGVGAYCRLTHTPTIQITKIDVICEYNNKKWICHRQRQSDLKISQTRKS